MGLDNSKPYLDFFLLLFNFHLFVIIIILSQYLSLHLRLAWNSLSCFCLLHVQITGVPHTLASLEPQSELG